MFYVREYWLENFGAVVGARAPLSNLDTLTVLPH